MGTLLHFVLDSAREALRGDARYRSWLALLLAIVGLGAWCYLRQLSEGLAITGMSDQVSWGLYIANFAFLVGIAASAVLLVVPAYVFHRRDLKQVVIIGEAMAVAAVLTAMLFVTVDIARPDRLLHLLPLVGRFNFPSSLLAWDVLVLTGYLLLNLLIAGYVLQALYRGREPRTASYFPFVLLAMFWAISIHTVTAFLFSANSARPFWHTSLLGPQFIATAFVSGPALIILVLQVLRRLTAYPVQPEVIRTLAVIMTISLQASLFFVGVELFTDFYDEGAHAASIRYLYLGLHGFEALRGWIWTALGACLVAVGILMINPLRRDPRFLNLACVLALLGTWIFKGMGLVVPGFVPTPLGEILEYAPTLPELAITAGCWALGMLIFTLLLRPAIAIQQGRLRAPGTDAEAGKGAAT